MSSICAWALKVDVCLADSNVYLFPITVVAACSGSNTPSNRWLANFRANCETPRLVVGEGRPPGDPRRLPVNPRVPPPNTNPIFFSKILLQARCENRRKGKHQICEIGCARPCVMCSSPWLRSPDAFGFEVCIIDEVFCENNGVRNPLRRTQEDLVLPNSFAFVLFLVMWMLTRMASTIRKV